MEHEDPFFTAAKYLGLLHEIGITESLRQKAKETE
jgi:hypothetical protein